MTTAKEKMTTPQAKTTTAEKNVTTPSDNSYRQIKMYDNSKKPGIDLSIEDGFGRFFISSSL